MMGYLFRFTNLDSTFEIGLLDVFVSSMSICSSFVVGIGQMSPRKSLLSQKTMYQLHPHEQDRARPPRLVNQKPCFGKAIGSRCGRKSRLKRPLRRLMRMALRVKIPMRCGSCHSGKPPDELSWPFGAVFQFVLFVWKLALY